MRYYFINRKPYSLKVFNVAKPTLRLLTFNYSVCKTLATALMIKTVTESKRESY